MRLLADIEQKRRRKRNSNKKWTKSALYALVLLSEKKGEKDISEAERQATNESDGRERGLTSHLHDEALNKIKIISCKMEYANAVWKTKIQDCFEVVMS